MRYFSLLCGFIGTIYLLSSGCLQGQSDQVSEIQFAEKMLLKNETLRDYYEINDEGIFDV